MKNFFLTMLILLLSLNISFAKGNKGGSKGGAPKESKSERCAKEIFKAGKTCITRGQSSACEKAVDRALDKCIGKWR